MGRLRDLKNERVGSGISRTAVCQRKFHSIAYFAIKKARSGGKAKTGSKEYRDRD